MEEVSQEINDLWLEVAGWIRTLYNPKDVRLVLQIIHRLRVGDQTLSSLEEHNLKAFVAHLRRAEEEKDPN
jgi:hypothetical protein